LLTWLSSPCILSLFCPAVFAALISVISRIAVATSALHGKQYVSVLPARTT
jgi:hypothetical protein